MDESLFAKLLDSVKWMELHRQGKARGRTTVVTRLDVKATRQRTGLSQAAFARLLQVSKGTLLNWEQGRRAPTGPARALLKAVSVDPEHVLRALNTTDDSARGLKVTAATPSVRVQEPRAKYRARTR